MGILDSLPLVGGLFRRQTEAPPQNESLLQVPLPMPTTSTLPKHESVVYMTENKSVPMEMLDSVGCGWDPVHMAFADLPNEYDRLRIVRRYEQERRIQENFQPLVKVYKPGMQDEIWRRQYANSVDITLSRAVGGKFQQRALASTNLIETKTQQVLPGQGNGVTEEKKRGGLAGLLGL